MFCTDIFQLGVKELSSVVVQFTGIHFVLNCSREDQFAVQEVRAELLGVVSDHGIRAFA